MNKLRVAQSFSRAAHTYDKAAHLQREIGQQLLELMPPVERADTIVDLGCGTGFFTQLLEETFPLARVLGVDIAKGMLDFAKARGDSRIDWLCADAESLPFCDNSIDIIFSSLAMQWCESTQQFLAEIKRVLKPEGVAFLSTLGSSTLQELNQSWKIIDNQPHVNEFISLNHLEVLVKQCAFSASIISKEEKLLMYSSPVDLMRELKELGAQEVTQRDSIGLMGKQRFQQFLKAYQKNKLDDKFPATYEVIYIRINK